jgi:branched-chain amino acid transport system substrate-binding protein
LLGGCAKRTVRLPTAPATITIGLLAASTGDSSATGRSAAQGAQLALDIVNTAHPELSLPLAARAGLRRGSRLVLAGADTKGVAGTGAQAAVEMIRSSRPVGLVVADSAEVAKAVGEKAEGASLPLVDAYSSADDLGLLGREWYFRTAPTDAMLLSTAFDALRRGTGVPPKPGAGSGDQAVASVRRIVTFDGASRTLSAAPEIPEIAQSHGFVVAGRLPLATGAADLVDKIGVEKPDAIIARVGTDQEAGVVNDTAQKMKIPVPVIALGPGVATVGRGVLRAVGWSADYAGRNPVTRAVSEMYRQQYGAPMNDAAAGAFTAVLTLAVAIDNAVASGAVNSTRVRAAIRQTDVQATETIMPWDGIQFDAAGQNALASGVVEQRAANDFQIVYPRELAPRAGAS